MSEKNLQKNDDKINMPSWITYLGIAFLCVISLIIGGIFGFRISQAQQNSAVATPQDIQAAVLGSQDNKPQKEVITVEGVFWILPGKQPVCPETHPVKGAMQTSGVSYFYTSASKQYNRVEPDICFATEAFAQDVAGFVKKY